MSRPRKRTPKLTSHEMRCLNLLQSIQDIDQIFAHIQAEYGLTDSHIVDLHTRLMGYPAYRSRISNTRYIPPHLRQNGFAVLSTHYPSMPSANPPQPIEDPETLRYRTVASTMLTMMGHTQPTASRLKGIFAVIHEKYGVPESDIRKIWHEHPAFAEVIQILDTF